MPAPLGLVYAFAMKRIFPLLAAAFVLLLAPPWPQTQAQEPFAWDRLAVVTASGARHSFRVEIARTPDQQAQGLQGRKSLAADAGMLFDFGTPRPAAFWMKNTLVSLDMIFIGGGGEIVKIVRDTTPLSLAVIPSDEPVRAVLEVRAGTAARLGIKPGDTVEHRIFQ